MVNQYKIFPLSLRKVCELLNVKHCICVCNGTIGLELVQRALNLNGEVIIPSLHLQHRRRWQKIDPAFCDVRSDNHLIDIEKIEALITLASAILAVPSGDNQNKSVLKEIALKHKINLIYDSAYAFG